MGSFSSVNNLRASLVTRWRHSVYRFSADEVFKYWFNERVSMRFVNFGLSKKLGIYFSHFVFSEAPAWVQTGFFIDTRLDWRYKRFPSLMLGVGYKKSRQFVKPISRYLKFVRSSGIRCAPVKQRVLRIYSNFKFLGSINSIPLVYRYSRFLNPRVRGFGQLGSQVWKHANVRCLWFRSLCSEVVVGLRYFAIPTKVLNSRRFRSGFHFLKCSVGISKARYKYPRLKPVLNQSKAFFCFYLHLAFLRRISSWGWRRLISWVSKSRVFVAKVSKPFKILPFFVQFRVILLASLRFFFSYYFRYYPMRFLRVLQSGIFRFVKGKSHPFPYSGYSPKWLRLGRKSVLQWIFCSGYMYFLRFRSFFCLIQNLKIVPYQLRIAHFDSQLVNLSRFGILPSALISNIFSRRLRRRERVNPVLYSLIRLVLSRKRVLGLVILRSGRFTKRQRAVRTPYRVGRVSYNSYIMPIDYSISTAILKYSIVSIKVWISTAPGVRFFRYISAGGSYGLIYPSSLGGGFIRGYSYIWRVVNSFRYSFPIRLKCVNFRPFCGSFFICRSEFKFLPSWNFSCIRAYRRFSKSFIFSRYKYSRKARVTSMIL